MEFAHEEGCHIVQTYQKPWCEETDSQISLGEAEHYEDDPWNYEAELEDYCGKRFSTTYEPLTFSGHSKNPEDYLRWESNMKQWLRSNNIPKRDKLSYAVSMLVGDAYNWWVKEDTYTFYHKPVRDWGDLKARMYREFVKKLHSHNSQGSTTLVSQASPKQRNPTPLVKPKPKLPFLPKTQAKIQGKYSVPINSNELTCFRYQGQRNVTKFCPTRKILTKTEPVQQNLSREPQTNEEQHTTHSEVSLSETFSQIKKSFDDVVELIKEKVLREKKQPNPKPLLVDQTQGTKTLLVPHGKLEQCKPCKPSKINEIICYRCRTRGHFAINCPARQVECHTPLEAKSDSLKPSDSLEKTVQEFSTSSIMLLSMPKVVDAGHIMEHEAKDVGEGISLEEQHLGTTTSQTHQRTLCEQPALKARVMSKHNSTPIYLDSKIIFNKAEWLPNTLHGTLVSGTYNLVRYRNNFQISLILKHSVFKGSNSSIIHLFFPLSVHKGLGELEKHKDQEDGDNKKSNILYQNQQGQVHLQPTTRDVEPINNTLMIKEEPPDPYQQVKTQEEYNGETRSELGEFTKDDATI